jgi:hypothetical protein
MLQGNFCLVCHANDEMFRISDIFQKQNENFRQLLERIVKRRIQNSEKFSNKLCFECLTQVENYGEIEAKLLKIETILKSNFDKSNPFKRGRKKKVEKSDEKVTENVENSEVRKSGRKRKLKEMDDTVFVVKETEFNENNIKIDGEDEKIQNKSKSGRLKHPKILSSMATKCPYCDFAADSIPQVLTIVTFHRNKIKVSFPSRLKANAKAGNKN